MRKKNQPGCPCCGEVCCSGCVDSPRSWLVTIGETEYRLPRWRPSSASSCYYRKPLSGGVEGCPDARAILLAIHAGHGFFLYLTDDGGFPLAGWNLDGDTGPQDCSIERTLAEASNPSWGCAVEFDDVTIIPERVASCTCCNQCGGDQSPRAWYVTIDGHSYTVLKDASGEALSPAEAAVSDETCVWLKAIGRDFCGGRSNYIRVRLWTVAAVHNMEVALLERLGPDWYTHGIWTKTRTSGVQGPFDCTATQTLDFTSGNLCDGPATVTAEPLQLQACPSGSGTGCHCCEDGTTCTRYRVEISGLYEQPGSTCDYDCADLNGTYWVELDPEWPAPGCGFVYEFDEPVGSVARIYLTITCTVGIGTEFGVSFSDADGETVHAMSFVGLVGPWGSADCTGGTAYSQENSFCCGRGDFALPPTATASIACDEE
jgi:hypothetical protein